MKQKRIFTLLTVFLLLLVTTSAVLAQSDGGKVVEDGDTIPNEVVLFGENLDIQNGATVEGDIVLFGGNAKIAGKIEGDIVLFGGDLTIEETAVFDGECVVFGGNLYDPSDIGENCTDMDFGPQIMERLSLFESGGMPPIPSEVPKVTVNRPSFFGRVAEAAGKTLVMALLAFGAASLLPNHLTQVETTIRQKPITSGSMGALTFFAVASVIFLLLLSIFICIGILFLPVTFLIGVSLIAAMVLGWITMGNLVGRWLVEKMNLQNRTLPVTAAFGTAALTFGMGFLSAIPSLLGQIFVFLVSIALLSVGLGAATLTRMGTRPYPLYTSTTERPITEDPDKINAILETLPIEDVEDLKNH